MTGLDQERLDQLAAARVLHEDDLAAFYALPREATAAENLAADVDPLLNDIGWLLGVVQQLRDEIESLGAMADRMITHARAERDDLRRELRRCRSEHPDNPTVVPCVLDRGHDGPHYSTTGCAGSVMEWPTAAAEIARLRAENENLRASMEDARRAIDASHRELMRKLGADRAGGDTTEPDGNACQACGVDNPIWFAPNALWNRVIGGEAGFLCPVCFIRRAEAAGVVPTGWLLIEEGSEQ